MPGRDALINAGFTNYAVLLNHGPIETIRGIDHKTAQKIRAYLGGDTEKSTDYTVAQLKDMDLSDKDAAFFEGDDRKSVQDLA